jgi:predicted permease
MPVAAGNDLPDGTFLLLSGHPAPTNFKEWGALAHDPAFTGHADFCVAGEAYFRTLEIPVLRGRLFDPHAGPDSPHEAVISQTLARQRWPNADPIGQTIEFGNMDGNLKPFTIVGVVGDVRAGGLDLPPSPIIYAGYRQRGFRASASPTLVLRASLPLSGILPAARAIFHDLSPDTPVKFSTFDAELGGWLSGRRFLLLLTGIFAGAALMLAAVGIYGVVAFSVARRTQEIGIRVALGAARRDVFAMILGEGARLALAGVALGLAASFGVTRLASSLFYGVSPTDPVTFGAVAAVLAGVALLASYLPARRALRLDPNTALRYE